MRDSRLPHPRGGRFVQLHAWAVQAVGHSAAAILGLLDFLDRAQERPGQLVAARARIIADLEGVVGHGAIDDALARLTELGWVRRQEKRIENNIGARSWYSLDAAAVARYLSSHGISLEIPVVPKSGQRSPDFGTETGTPSTREKECSAATGASRDKTWFERPSGITGWTAADVAKAELMEAETPMEELRDAVARCSARGVEPYPGRVARELRGARKRAATLARGEQNARRERERNVRTEIKKLEELAAKGKDENVAAAIRGQAARLRAQLPEHESKKVVGG